MRIDINPVERLARRLCRALPPDAAMSLAELKERLSLESQEAKRFATRLRTRRLQGQEGDFAEALDFAVASGWVSATFESCMLTEAGIAFARHSRVGAQRRRSIF